MTQKFNYYKQNSGFPTFFPYPWFVLGLDLSEHAKTIYALMTDRVRASMANNWLDSDGKYYIIYTYAELVKKTGMGKKTVQRAIRELKEKGFIESKRQGQGKPNRIYVKYPDNIKMVERNPTPAQSSEGTDMSTQERSDMSVSERTDLSYIVKNNRVNNNKNNNRIHNFEERVYDDVFFKKFERKAFINLQHVPKS